MHMSMRTHVGVGVVIIQYVYYTELSILLVRDDDVNFDPCSASDVAALKQQKRKSSKDTS